MAFNDPREVVALAARTTGGDSGVEEITDEGKNLNLLCRVSAASGTSPSLALSIEWGMDGTNFGAADPADAFAAITAVPGRAKQLPIKGKFYRVVWAITGTSPSFTFTITEFIT